MIVPKEYNRIFTKGLQSALNNTPIEDGKLRFTTDTGRLYLDIVEGENKSRVRISAIEDSYTEEQILSMIVALPKIYVASDTGRAYISIDGGWVDIGPVKLEEDTSTNKELVLWFSDSDSEQPAYNNKLTYNPITDTFKCTNIEVTTIKVGQLNITDTVNEDGSHTVDFKF